ncbi:hypothetical protein, partial [Wolbachia endosymbiont of Atemnus politus]|uniref:hypothetical protein n=1 Tax=Wolbachia endosymbiont of Atemnus politus TaxID=2682840 RepID=UPI001C5530B3
FYDHKVQNPALSAGFKISPMPRHFDKLELLSYNYMSQPKSQEFNISALCFGKGWFLLFY